MVKVKLETDNGGFITRMYRVAYGGTELPDEIYYKIIPGVTKLVGNIVYYRCKFDYTGDGFILGGGTDPTGDTIVSAENLATLIPERSKLIDGEIITYTQTTEES